MKSVAERFWEKVNKNGPMSDACGSPCWLWTASVKSTGYGNFGVGGTMANAHRFSFEMANGPIAGSFQVDHLCRVRACVNPLHLEAVTQRENILRGVGAPAIHAKKTHCLRGHPLLGVNVYFRGDHFGRECRACGVDRARARYAAKHDQMLVRAAAYRAANRERINANQNAKKAAAREAAKRLTP